MLEKYRGTELRKNILNVTKNQKKVKMIKYP